MGEREQENSRKSISVCKWLCIGSLIMLFIVGIPLGINECYKADCGYITLWGADTVLLYYGNILAAVGTIIGVCITVCFAKEQIHWEMYQNYSMKKWKLNESVIDKALDSIAPQKLSTPKLAGNIEKNYLQEILSNLNKCKTRAIFLCNNVRIYIDTDDYSRVQSIGELLDETVEDFNELEKKLHEMYLNADPIFDRTIGNMNSSEKRKKIDDFNAKLEEMQEKSLSVYAEKYDKLVVKKKKIFEEIYFEINKQAEKMLNL